MVHCFDKESILFFGSSSSGSLFNVPSSNFPDRDLPYLRGQEAGIQNQIGSDNSFLNEAIPDAAGSSLGQEAFHQRVGSTREQDQTGLSQRFYRIEDGQSFALVAPPTRPLLRWGGYDY